MATLPSIDVSAVFVLNGEDASKSVVPDASANLSTDTTPPTPAALPVKRPNFLTFEELIDEELIHNEVINRDE